MATARDYEALVCDIRGACEAQGARITILNTLAAIFSCVSPDVFHRLLLRRVRNVVAGETSPARNTAPFEHPLTEILPSTWLMAAWTVFVANQHPVPRGEWRPGVTYRRGDAVRHADATHVCRRDHVSMAAGPPAGLPDYWAPLRRGFQRVPVTQLESTSASRGRGKAPFLHRAIPFHAWLGDERAPGVCEFRALAGAALILLRWRETARDLIGTTRSALLRTESSTARTWVWIAEGVSVSPVALALSTRDLLALLPERSPFRPLMSAETSRLGRSAAGKTVHAVLGHAFGVRHAAIKLAKDGLHHPSRVRLGRVHASDRVRLDRAVAPRDRARAVASTVFELTRLPSELCLLALGVDADTPQQQMVDRIDSMLRSKHLRAQAWRRAQNALAVSVDDPRLHAIETYLEPVNPHTRYTMRLLMMMAAAAGAVTVPAPPGAVTATLSELGRLEAYRRTARSSLISSADAVLPGAPTQTENFTVVGGAVDVPACSAPQQTGCVWAGGAYNATFVAGNGTVLEADRRVDVAATCTITVDTWTLGAGNKWCAEVHILGTVPPTLAFFGDVLTVPGYPLVDQGDLDDVRYAATSNSTSLCGIEPVGRYHLWAGNSAPACRATVVAPRVPLDVAPTIVRTRQSQISSTTVSFFFTFARYTDEIEQLIVTYTDTSTNLTLSSLWTGFQVVPTLQVDPPWLLFRTFIVGTTPNTRYDITVATAANGTKLSPESEVITETTFTEVQPRPVQPTVEFENATHVRVRPVPERQFGATNRTLFVLYVADLNTLDGAEIGRTECPGTCPDGILITETELRDRGTVFVGVVVVNDRGPSEQSGVLAVTPRPTPQAGDGDDRLSVAEIVGIALGAAVACLLLAVLAVIRRRGAIEVVEIVRPTPDAYEVKKSEIRSIETVGEGASSVVSRGLLRRAGDADDTEVAIKRMRTSVVRHADFFGEIAALKTLRHRNVIRLIGCVTVEDPIMILTEFCPGGSVLRRVQTAPADDATLARWGRDMILAVQYLHSHDIVHRDVAARNFLVHADDRLVICDLGMHRVVDDTYFHRLRIDVAIRWAAPDVLYRHVTTRGTDVWALCVALWEIHSGGTKPYVEFDTNNEVVQALGQGHRLALPESMPMRLRAIVAAVWRTRNLDQTTTAIFRTAFDLNDDDDASAAADAADDFDVALTTLAPETLV